MSKVTSYKLSPEEIEQMQKGEKTYDEIIANKQPVKRDADLSVLTRESYAALIHDSCGASDIRKRFNLKPFELESLLREWAHEDGLKRSKNKPKNKPANKPKNETENKPKREVETVKSSLTKVIFTKLIEEGKSNKQIMEEYKLNNVSFYKLKNDWGLVKAISKRGEVKPEITKAEAHEAKVISVVVFNKVQKELDHANKMLEHSKMSNDKYLSQLAEKDKVINELESKLEVTPMPIVGNFEKDLMIQDLNKAENLVARLQKLRSEDVLLIDQQKEAIAILKQELKETEVKYSETNERLDAFYKKLEENKTAYKAPEEKMVVAETKCECPDKINHLETKILKLRSGLAVAENNNIELINHINSIEKYKKLYFLTASALKLHLPS